MSNGKFVSKVGGYPDLYENAEKILNKRYYHKDKEGNVIEDFNKLCERVAGSVARAELSFNNNANTADYEHKFFDLMRSLRFIPNTPTLVNAGRARGQLAACYVLPIKDSMEGIMDTLKNQALVQKSGGGTGFSLSAIRERGSKIASTDMKAAGPIPVIKLMNYLMSEFITQGGVRNGANMAVLPVDHNDIEEFITFKEKDNSCPSFNVSIAATDEFMRAVENDDVIWTKSRIDGTPIRQIKARDIFHLVATFAWKTGDPGILFIDTANKDNPTPHLGRLEATNPCFSGDTLISTDVGLLPIRDIVRGQKAAKALAPDGTYEDIIARFDNGVKDLFKVTTTYGYNVTVTSDHKWTTGRGEIATKDLLIGDTVAIQPSVPESVLETHNQNDFDKGELIGWIVGDGYIAKDASKSKTSGVIIGDADKEYIPHIKKLIKDNTGEDVPEYRYNKYSTTQLLSASRLHTWAVRDNNITAHKSAHKEVPECVFAGSMSMQRGFLRGIFSADGQVYKRRLKTTGALKQGIRLSSKSKVLLEGVRTLLAQIGISANLLNRSRPPREDLFTHTKKDGSIVTYGSDGIAYELDLQSPGWSKFQRHIGFTQKYKNDVLATIVDTKASANTFKGTLSIKSIEPAGTGETFNLTVSPTHHVCANGIVIKQCGEQWLLPNEACTLAHHNLSKYFIQTTSTDWKDKINWAQYAEDIVLGVRFLDNVIEINHYATPDIERVHRILNRKIGLGIMGFADLLIKMGVPYASEQARIIASEIARFHRTNADQASSKLAEERGSFGSFEGSAVQKAGWKAMRNACRTTVAPTGTTAIIAHSSTGIEINFSLVLKRHQAGMDMYEIHPIFEDFLNKNKQFSKESILDYYVKNGGIKNCPFLTEDEQALFATANEISYRDHVLMQAAWQGHVDNSISKTINMHRYSSIEDVKDAYMLAWKTGCKGITVYRDGCRDNQALNIATVSDMSVVLKESAKCPECSSDMEISGGCETCKSCGYAVCKT